MIAGEATEGTDPGDGAILRPGPVRVHGGRHGLQGPGLWLLDQPARPRTGPERSLEPDATPVVVAPYPLFQAGCHYH